MQSFFSLGRLKSSFYILIETDWTEQLITEFSRYLIMEDVRFEIVREGEFTICTGALASFLRRDDQIPVHGLAFQGHLLDEEDKKEAPVHSIDDLKKVAIYSGVPIWGKSIEKTDFVNETILNRYGISYDKGCFFWPRDDR